MTYETFIINHIENHYCMAWDYDIMEYCEDFEFWIIRHDEKLDVFLVEKDIGEIKRIAENLPNENLYYCENEKIYTESEIYKEYLENSAEDYEADGCDFADYIAEATGKNGTLELIYKA